MVREVEAVPLRDDEAVLDEGGAAVGAVQRQQLLAVGEIRSVQHFVRRDELAHFLRGGGGQDHGREARVLGVLHHALHAGPVVRAHLLRVIDRHDHQLAFDQLLVHIFAGGVADRERRRAVVRGVVDVPGEHQLGARLEGREVHERDVERGIEQEEADGHGGDGEADVLYLARDLDRAEGQERERPHGQQDEVLDQALGVRQVDDLAEAAAVDVGVLDVEQQGQEREGAQHDARHDGHDAAPHARDEGGADERLEQGHAGAEEARCAHQEVEMQELEVFLHDEAGAHGIHELEDAREEEHEADQDGANPSDNSHRQL